MAGATIRVKCKDGKGRRVLLSEWQNGKDPLTVYNQFGYPLYMTDENRRKKRLVEIARNEIVGTWNEHWNKVAPVD